MGYGALYGGNYGVRRGPGYGPRTKANSSGLVGVSQDATSLIYLPASSAEWTTFNAALALATGNPQHLYLLQDAAGNPADLIGAKNLTANNSPSYLKNVAGWARKAIGGSGDGVGNETLTNAAMVDTATTSFVLFVIATNAQPSGTKVITDYGVTAGTRALSTGLIRASSGANNQSSAADLCDATARPYVIVYNRTAGTFVVYVDSERWSPTFSATTGTTLMLNCQTNAITADSNFLYAAAWDGAPAELFTNTTAKALLQGLGFTVPWAP